MLAAGAVSLFLGLGSRDLWPPDEPRYAAIAEELRSFAHGWRGLVLLHQNGAVYTQKPPLYFWLAALAGAPAGRVTEAAARLPSALAGFGTLLLTAWLGRAMFRARTGVLAAALLLTTPSWLQLARSARLDALLTVFVLLAFVAAWRLDRSIGDAGRSRVLLHAALGLGVVTKGPVAFLLPLLGLVAYLGWERRLGRLRAFGSAPTLLLSVAPGLVWLAAAAGLAPSGFVGVSFWDNLVLRFAGADAPHARPAWFYLEALPRGFLPWTLLWPLVWLRYRAAQRAAAPSDGVRALRFLLAAIGAAVLFLSFSAGKRGVYLIPIHPLLALASAEGLAGWLDAGASVPRWLRLGLACGAFAVALAGLGTIVFDRVAGIELPAAFGLALAGGSLLALSLEPALRARTAPRTALVGALLCFALALELSVHLILFPALDVRNSLRPVAELAASVSEPGQPIGVYRKESLAGGIGYYSGRPAHDLREPADLAGFAAAGGRVIVVEDDDFAELHSRVPLRELGWSRCRQRRFRVVTASPAQPGAQ